MAYNTIQRHKLKQRGWEIDIKCQRPLRQPRREDREHHQQRIEQQKKCTQQINEEHQHTESTTLGWFKIEFFSD